MFDWKQRLCSQIIVLLYRSTNKRSGYKCFQAFYLLSDSIRLLFIKECTLPSRYERWFVEKIKYIYGINVAFPIVCVSATDNPFIPIPLKQRLFIASEIHNWVWLIALFNLFLHLIWKYYIVCKVPIFDTFAKVFVFIDTDCVWW